MANIYGRQVVVPLTNKSGGAIIAGDVVIVDTSNDSSFTTTTSGRVEVTVGIAQEAIANNASGRVLISGYAALVNVPASVTRGHYIETHTVAKQATGNSARRSGSFGQFLTGGTTPIGVLWGQTDQTASGGTAAFVGASATHNTTQSITTATVTIVALNTENFDSSTLHDTVTNNNRITVATSGKYQVNAGVQWASNTSGQRILGIRKNGTTVKEVEQNFAVAAIDGHSQSVSMIVSLASTDYVEMVVYQTSGGPLNLQSGQGLPLLDVGFLGT